MKLNTHRYGVTRFLYELEGLYMNSKYLQNRFYFSWIGLAESDKEGYRRQVRRLVFKHLLGKSFKYALARDVLCTEISAEGDVIVSVNVKSYLFKYLKTRVYKGNTREMIIDLQSFCEGYEKESRDRKAKYIRQEIQ